MTLDDIVARQAAPEPWAEGDNIPWNEPGFSRRMLREHLSQAHDAASRRFETIDRHVAWIHSELLRGGPARVLDLCCGPGLYTSRLARLGHECVGIDFGPASIEYAREEAARDRLACRYECADVRLADYGSGHHLAMLVFGELNVFPPADAGRILDKARNALAPGGVLLLEPHTFGIVRELGTRGPSWYSSPGGLFSERPHLVLEESHWSEETRTTITRWHVVDAASATVTRYSTTMQAYRDEEYAALLGEQGFTDMRFHSSLAEEADGGTHGLMAITATAGKREE